MAQQKADHPVFGCEVLGLQSEKYGNLDAVVVGGDRVESDAWVNGKTGGLKWYAPIETKVEDGTLPLSMWVSVGRDESQPTVFVEERVGDDEYESIGITGYTVLE